jgi:FkbM family methyltransferase
MRAETLRNLLFRLRYGFRGVPFTCLGRAFRLDESLRRWRTDGEDGVMRVLVDSLRLGDVFVDVGANFGLHTILGADCVGPTGRVIAIEPVPGNCRLLKRNIELNGFGERVSVIAKAVSDTAVGQAVLHGVTDGVSVAASMRHGEARGGDLVTDVTTLDECLADVAPAVRLVKIDVEGAEHRVIRGARQLLEQQHPLLLVEVHEFALADFNTSADRFRDDLGRIGYEERVIDVVEGAEGRYYHALYAHRG